MSRPAASPRLFVALRPGAELRSRLRAAQGSLERYRPHLRFVPAEQLHLTLKFLGPLPESSRGPLTAALARAAAAIDPFSFDCGPLGVFPHRRRPRVLWAGVETGVRPLSAAFVAVEDALLRLGIARDRRAFNPHLTIARFRTPAIPPADLLDDLDHLRIAPGVPSIVTDLLLLQSHLEPTGARYERLGAFPLHESSQEQDHGEPHQQG